MITLDHTKSLELFLSAPVTTNEIDITATWHEMGGINDPFSQIYAAHVFSAGVTPITVIASPRRKYTRQIKTVSIFNNDTVAVELILRVRNLSVYFTIVAITLESHSTLSYISEEGWSVIDKNGAIAATSSVNIDGFPEVGHLVKWIQSDTIGDSGVTVDDFAPISHIANTDNPHNTSDQNILLSDIINNNATVDRHGFLPKLSGDENQFLSGTGLYATIPGVTVPSNYLSVDFSNTNSVNVIHDFAIIPLVQVIINNEIFSTHTVTHNSDNDFTVSFSQPESGTIIASVGSPISANVSTINANITLDETHNIVIINASGITVTLPSAVGLLGKRYTIYMLENGISQLVPAVNENIRGKDGFLFERNDKIVIESTGAFWI